MKIMIDILHPGHVHFFKYFIQEMLEKGNDVLVTSRKKEIAEYLLDIHHINHMCISSLGEKKIDLATELFSRTLKFLCIARKFKPDILLGIMGPTIAPAGKIMNVPSYVFYDSEVATPTNFYVYPLATKIITPESYRNDLGKKQIRYNGFQETAYLHPNRFSPDSSILEELGVGKNEPFFIMRFVSWQASHDVSYRGLSLDDKRGVVNILKEYGQVFITSEKSLPSDLNKFRIRIRPERIHDALYYCTLFVSDSQTMSTEAAILGTPVVRCNAFVGPNDMGNFIDLENEYDMMYNYSNAKNAINKVKELLESIDHLKKEWNIKKNKFFEGKTDVTEFMIDFIEKIYIEV